MSDWKNKVDSHIEEQKRREEEAKRRLWEEGQRRIQDEERRKEEEEDRKRTKLGNKFRCHICGAGARIPGQKSAGTGYQSYGEVGSSYTIYEDDWSKPGDLYRCTRCNQWTCLEHIHKGLCQECAERL